MHKILVDLPSILPLYEKTLKLFMNSKTEPTDTNNVDGDQTALYKQFILIYIFYLPLKRKVSRQHDNFCKILKYFHFKQY